MCMCLIRIGLVVSLLVSFSSNGFSAGPVKIILDTDMLTDPEDVNAVWMLNALADRGEAEILACVINGHESNRASAAAVDVVNTWFGRPNIPLGTFKGKYPVKTSPFTPLLRDKYPHSAPSDDALPDSVEIYRKVLAAQPDSSVKIVSIGFLMNLADLLDSKPDQFSSLSGPDLIRAKVKELVVMGGKYPQGREYNFYFGGVQNAAAKVVNEWPSEVRMVFSGYEVGGSIISGRTYKQTLPEGPLRLALANQYGALDKGRESWDETAVLFAVRGGSFDGVQCWKLNSSGHNVVDIKDGSNKWVDSPNRNQAYMIIAQPVERIGQVIEDLVLNAKPRNANCSVQSKTSEQVGMHHGSFAGTEGCLILEASQPKIRAVVAPSIGARIAEYSLAGENILWDNPDPSGKPRSVGGHQCDVGPEIRNIPSHPVLMSKAYTCETANDGAVRFTSAPCLVLGLVCEKRIRMGHDGSMSIEHVMKNVADKEQTYCHWDRTLCKAGGFAFFRLNKKSRFPAGWGIGRRSKKQPWEYEVEKPAHPNIKVLDGVLVAQALGPEQKIGADTDGGWIAYVRGRLLFVKHFPCNPQGDYTDCGMSVALYYNDKFAEIEPMSPEISLKPKQEYVFGEKWTLTFLEREVTTHEQARALADGIPAVSDLVLR